MRIFSLQDSLTYAAFGTLDIPLSEQNKQRDKIETAKVMLRAAFIAGRVHLTADDKDFPIKNTYAFDWPGNRIFAATGEYFTDACAKTNIRVCTDDLIREFPSNHKHPLNPPKGRTERPERRIAHDIAFYFWENNKQLTAKQLWRKLCDVLNGYPEFQTKGKDPVSFDTMRKWLSDFKKGEYKPTTDKHKLSAQYKDIFSKLRNAQ